LIIGGTFALSLLVGSAALPNKPPDIHEASRPADPEVDPNSAEFLAQLISTPRGPIELDGTEAILGLEDAPYLLVEWADYGCPHCARASMELKQLVQEFPQIQVRFKTYPLTSACNPSLDFDGGPERCKAAMTAECAQSQGKFWELQRLLFANQGRFSDDDLAYMAKQVGLDMDGWFACMESQAVVDGILEDARAGSKAGVTGTPAMFLKGTHGDRFVEVVGAGAALRLIEVHSNGGMLPEPGPPRGH
jgi:protein-disulfide isomerase